MATAKAAGVSGSLWGWGSSNNGQLGQGNILNKSSPVQLGALTDVIDAITGQNFVICVTSEGKLYGAGYNYNGELALGDKTNRSVLTQIGALTDWSRIFGFPYGNSVMAVKADGTLWTWGANTQGVLGLGDTTNRSSPSQVGALTDWSYGITDLPGSMMAVKTDGTLWGWGQNGVGELGINLSAAAYSSPVQAGAETDWAALNISSYTSNTHYGIRTV